VSSHLALAHKRRASTRASTQAPKLAATTPWSHDRCRLEDVRRWRDAGLHEQLRSLPFHLPLRLRFKQQARRGIRIRTRSAARPEKKPARADA